MIYTVTFNPAIDYIVHIDNIQQGFTNRTSDEEFFCGGKGINVSTILSRLDMDTTALGFAAGFTGEYILGVMKQRGIKTDFIMLKSGNTRINVKIKGKNETELNAQGPDISSEEFGLLMDKLDKLTSEDILIISGSIPKSLAKNTYEIILERLKDKNIKTVVDTTDELLLNVLKYHPFLIKPNIDELGEIFDKQLSDKQEIINCAKELQNKGALNVLVSMGSKGALLVTENGEIIIGPPVNRKIINSVGSGDSMIAGFISGYLKTGDYKTAMMMGVACGASTAFSHDLAEKEDILTLFNSLKEF